jgi:starvation-inducible outer membrane lipoprotein
MKSTSLVTAVLALLLSACASVPTTADGKSVVGKSV